MRFKESSLFRILFYIGWSFLLIIHIYNNIDDGTPISNGMIYLFFILICFIILLMNAKRIKLRNREMAICLIYILFIIWSYGIGQFGKYSNEVSDNVITYSIFLILIFLSAECLKILKCYYGFISLSFYIIGAMLIERFLIYKNYLSGINVLMSFRRIGNYTRISFGFSHVNVMGNICLLEICLGVLLLSQIYKEKELGILKKYIFYISSISIIILDITIMLLTSTRTAILCALLFLCMLLLIKIYYTNTKKIRIASMVVLFLLFTVLFVYAYFSGMVSWYFIDSIIGRDNSTNLQLMKSVKQIILGIGFVQPGLFGKNALGYTTTWMDNYYIYIFVTTGVVGCILNLGSIIIVGKHLYLEMKKNHGSDGAIVFTIFITLCLSGMMETCVMYPHYLFSIVAFVLFLAIFFDADKGKFLSNEKVK